MTENPAPTEAIVFLYNPARRLPNGNLMPSRMVGVTGDIVLSFQMSLAAVKAELSKPGG